MEALVDNKNHPMSKLAVWDVVGEIIRIHVASEPFGPKLCGIVIKNDFKKCPQTEDIF